MKKNRLIKLLILILVLLIVSFKLESQVFTSFSLDPNMAMGWGVTNKSGLNHKTNVGYRINRFELSSWYEGYTDINFDSVISSRIGIICYLKPL